MKRNRLIKYRNPFIVLAVTALLTAVFVPTLPVRAAPVITLSPASGAVGTAVTVSGTVFNSYEGDSIHIFFDATEAATSPVTVPEGGEFAAVLNVPADAAAGEHRVEIRTDITSTSVIAGAAFTVDATELTLDSSAGPPGAYVDISGSGFYVGATVNIYFNNPDSQKIGAVTASSTGKFVHSAAIPPAPHGMHTITATNNMGNSAEAQFSVLPEIKLNRDTAGPGELLNVRGSGFAATSGVSIYFGQFLAATTATDTLGSFESDIEVPDVIPLAYEIKCQDENGNSGTAEFTVSTGVKLSAGTGAVGGDLTIRGIGFKPNTAVTVNYDGEFIAAAVTDKNGDFTVTITVPAGNAGGHIISASDGTTTKDISFAIETEPPPMPVLSLPANGSLTRAEAYFDWPDVIDASVPVTYNLEIASDQNFASPVLLKTGLEESEYTLTDSEALDAGFKNSPYFWRVKATDGAGNIGEWSASSVFYISVPAVPAPALPANDSPLEYPIRFSWQAVTSLSPPVTYDFQISQNLDFTTPILDEAGLGNSELLVTKENNLKLKKGVVYYWRVKAVDAAHNSSDWSPTGSFRFAPKSAFPGWAIYTMISIGAVIAVLFAFRLGRKTAYPQY